jgi:AAA domain
MGIHTMDDSPINPFSEDEKKILSYFQDLLSADEDNRPGDASYRDFDDRFFFEVAQVMYDKRINGGVRALKAYIVSLRKIQDPEYERLLQVLLNGSVDLESDVGTLLSDVKPQKILGPWLPYLVCGKITTLDGDPSLGKTNLCIDVSARTTREADMPDGTPCLTPGGVVIIMPEDGLEDTILPRFVRAGADLSKVVDLSTVKTDDSGLFKRSFQLQTDLDYLETAIYRVNAKLVIIDPLVAVAEGTDLNNDQAVRALLLPLKMLIEQHQVACILVRHMTKTRVQNPLMAGSGSIGLIGLARNGLMVTQSPTNKSQVILSHIKSNTGSTASDIITYTIRSDKDQGDDRPYIVWRP